MDRRATAQLSWKVLLNMLLTPNHISQQRDDDAIPPSTGAVAELYLVGQGCRHEDEVFSSAVFL